MHIVPDLQQTLFVADNMIHAPLKKNVSKGLDLGGGPTITYCIIPKLVALKIRNQRSLPLLGRISSLDLLSGHVAFSGRR